MVASARVPPFSFRVSLCGTPIGDVHTSATRLAGLSLYGPLSYSSVFDLWLGDPANSPRIARVFCASSVRSAPSILLRFAHLTASSFPVRCDLDSSS